MAKLRDKTRLLMRRVAAVVGKQPAAIAMGPPQPAQIVEDWPG
jgi:hypothetical protein